MNEIYQSLVTVEPFTLVVTILNLFLQIYLVKKFLLDKIMDVLDQRRQMADREIADAQTAKEEALVIKKTYEENMQTAKERAEEIIREAKKSAAARGEEILGNARNQAAHLKQKAAQDIAQEKKKALNDAKDEISHMAMAIAAKVVGRSLNGEDRRHLTDRFIEDLGEGL